MRVKTNNRTVASPVSRVSLATAQKALMVRKFRVRAAYRVKTVKSH
jgi:hypothetical protein